MIPEMISQADAVVAAWLPGSEAAALGELLCGLWPFEATTPQPWPRNRDDIENDQNSTYEMGHGLQLPPNRPSQELRPEPSGTPEEGTES